MIYFAFTPLAVPSVALSATSAPGTTLGPWQPIPSLFSVTSVSFPSANTGWVLGPRTRATNSDVVVMTNDGGRTWHEHLTRPVQPHGES